LINNGAIFNGLFKGQLLELNSSKSCITLLFW